MNGEGKTMAWLCRMIEKPELDEHGNVDLKKRQIGDMWFLDLPESERRERHLSAQYWAQNAHRMPIVLALPVKYYGGAIGVSPFVVDGQCFSGDRGYYDGWTVTGTPPQLTIHPSINMVGQYHGFLHAGVLSDDCEGRKFG